MNFSRSLELMKKYTSCPECGNAYVSNGEGKLIIEGNTFYRSCKCGWEVKIEEGDPRPKANDTTE